MGQLCSWFGTNISAQELYWIAASKFSFHFLDGFSKTGAPQNSQRASGHPSEPFSRLLESLVSTAPASEVSGGSPTPGSRVPEEPSDSSSHLWRRRGTSHGRHTPSPERLNSCFLYGTLRIMCAILRQPKYPTSGYPTLLSKDAKLTRDRRENKSTDCNAIGLQIFGSPSSLWNHSP